MPKNNSAARKSQRRKIASTRQTRIDERHGDELFTRDMAAMRTLVELKQVADDMANSNVLELEIQRMHHCGHTPICMLTPRACSAINQNMPPNMIEG